MTQVAALSIVALTLPSAFISPASPAAPSSTSPYMRVCGLQFCIGPNTFSPYGATMFQSTPQAGIRNPAGAISLALAQHLNTIRLVDFLKHNKDPSTAPYDPSSWAKVDTFIADAEAANIKIVLDLSDYKAELWNACINPYTSSWTKYLAYVAHRVNTVTGRRYAADPGIVLVTFTGEPLVVGTHSFTDDAGASCSISYTTAQLTQFYATVEGQWKSLDRNHLTAAGGLANVDLPNSGIDWQSIFANRANDVCSWKTYGDMFTWLPTGAQYCQNVLHKPWFNDEWGYTQAMGDSARAAAFSSQFANNAHNGAAGNFYWNANYLVGPTTFDVSPATPLTQAVVVDNAPPPVATQVPSGPSGPAGGWTVEGPPSDIYYLSGVSCPTVTDCLVSGGDVALDATVDTTIDGTSWTATNVAGGVVGLTGISCPSSAVCFATGDDAIGPVVLATTTGGSKWTTVNVPSDIIDLTGLSCPSPAQCFVTGDTTTASVVLTTSTGGSSWTNLSVPSGIVDLTGISCPTTTACFASGDTTSAPVVLTTTTAGTVWTSANAPGDVTGLTGISCPSTTACFVSGSTTSAPVVLTTVTDGISWTTTDLPSDMVDLTGIACRTVATCVVSGDSTNSRPVILAMTPGILGSGAKLVSGSSIDPSSAPYRLTMQSDGNLVEYDGPAAVWASGTNPSGSYAIMQGDGNLVVYDSSAKALWASNTSGNPGAYLSIGNDGELAVNAATGVALWGAPGVLVPGQPLARGHSLFAPAGQYRLTMQSDGNLVEYDGTAPVWASGTSPSGSYAIMQGDGNLVVYDSSAKALWATNTSGNPGAYLSLGNDGELAVNAATGVLVWSNS